jgi:hypothetical protein
MLAEVHKQQLGLDLQAATHDHRAAFTTSLQELPNTGAFLKLVAGCMQVG